MTFFKIKIKNNLLNVKKEGRPCVKDNIIYYQDGSTKPWNNEEYEEIPQTPLFNVVHQEM